MTLAEKRLISAIKDNELPAFTEEFKQMCSVDIPVEIDWDSFDGNAEAMESLRLGHHGLGAIRQAFHQICRDDLGKTSVREEISKIIIRNAANSMEDSITLHDGVLVVNWRWDGSDSPYENIVAYLEEAL
jgi:hypothetical protein